MSQSWQCARGWAVWNPPVYVISLSIKQSTEFSILMASTDTSVRMVPTALSTALLSPSTPVGHFPLPSRHFYLVAFVFYVLNDQNNPQTTKKQKPFSSFRDGLFQLIEILVSERICVFLQTLLIGASFWMSRIGITWKLLEMQTLSPHPRLADSQLSFR